MNYHHANGHASENLPAYDFRKDFSTIAKPGLHRYLDAIGAPPDNGDWVNLRWYPARQYVRHLWNGLNHIQRNYHEFGRSCDTEIYDIKHWTRESVTAYVEARLEDILTSIEPEEPIDVYRAVHLGTEMAREQGYACEPEAIAYTADRLKSKIERDAVYNPVTTAHDGILTYYQWVKPQAERRRAQGRGDGKVVYIDRYKQRREAREAKQKQEQEQEQERSERADRGKKREPMFQRAGLIVPKPRNWIVKGLVPVNEACNPFGRPNSFKGVVAAQLAAHIAGGVDFLDIPVKQGVAAYFAGERSAQVQRRVNGHIRRLGLPVDLPCYVGGRPLNLLDNADVEYMLREIDAMQKDAGADLAFLVIDTQDRTLGGDGNAAKDGGAYAKAIERLRRDVNKVVTLWVIAHTGHGAEEQHRPKGSTNLLGAYDTFPRFKKVGEQRGEIEIMIDRDASGGGMKWAFEVASYDTGAVNENGEPVTIPVIKPSASEDKPCSFTFREPGGDIRPAQTTDGEKEALRGLTRALQDHGLVTPEGEGIYASEGDEDIPPGEVTVSTEAWRTTFYKLDRERSPDAGRKAFNRALDGLVKKGLVGKYSDRFWPK